MSAWSVVQRFSRRSRRSRCPTSPRNWMTPRALRCRTVRSGASSDALGIDGRLPVLGTECWVRTCPTHPKGVALTLCRGATAPPGRRWLRSSVALPVVEAARRAAVGLGGLPAGRVGNDVVDLAVLGGEVTELMEALAVPELHR